MTTSKKFDLSSETAIEDAAIHASDAVNKSAAGTQALIAALVSICPTDKKGQQLWLSSKLPALVRGWDAQRSPDGALVVAADNDSTRSARKRLIGAVKQELDGSMVHNFTFIGKSRKVNGAMVAYYEWLSADDAEAMVDKKEKAAATRKKEKEQEQVKKEAAAISAAVADAVKDTVPVADFKRLQDSIVSPHTADVQTALIQLAAWARCVNKHGATLSEVQHALAALSGLVQVSAKAPAKPAKVKPAKNRDTLAA